MKYLIFFLLVSTIGYAQEIEDILKTKQFVLEANKITDDEGNTNAAVRKLCFILVDSTNIVIQWVSDYDNNGFGGITIGGNINSFEHTENKIEKETQHILTLSCETDQGRVKSELVIEIYNKSHADATLKNSTPSIFVPKEMRFLGRLVPLHSSKVVVGAH